MDWSKVGDFLIGNGLPLLGGVVGGPAGAAVGKLVASAIGVSAEDPAAVLAAVEADPQALVRLREVEARHAEELTRLTLTAETQRIAEVNATMRTEAASDRWWVSGWRPFWGFVSAIAWAAFVGAIAWRIAAHGDLAQLIGQVAQVPEAVWYVPLVILGVASWHRGVEKRVRAGEPPAPGVLGRVLGAIGNRS